MNKKGFTLIELLAVILILGIIALIAIPTINTIITDSKKSALKVASQNLITAAETKCQIEKMKSTTLTDQYTFTSTGVYPKLDVKGELPIAGSIALNDECEAVASLTDGNYVVKKSLLSEEYSLTEGKEANDNLISPLNPKVKVNDIYYSLEMPASIDLNIFSDPEIKTFVSAAKGNGFSVTYDEANKIIGAFELAIIPNIYTREVARDYAVRAINGMKIYDAGHEQQGTVSGLYYYITDDYIFLMEGIKEITDPTVQAQFQTIYEETIEDMKQYSSEMSFEHIRMEY